MLRPAPSKNNSDAEKIPYIQLETLSATKDILAAHTSVLHRIASTLEQLSGQLTMLATRVDEASGVPQGQYVTIFQAATTQNTVYTSVPLSINGTIRNMMISGPGNITVKLLNPNVSTVADTILVVACNGLPTETNIHFRASMGYVLQISTDSTSTNSLALTAWIEPAALSADKQYTLRNR